MEQNKTSITRLLIKELTELADKTADATKELEQLLLESESLMALNIQTDLSSIDHGIKNEISNSIENRLDRINEKIGRAIVEIVIP